MESSSKEQSKGTEITLQGLREAFEALTYSATKTEQKINYCWLGGKWFMLTKEKVYQLKSSYGLVEKELTHKEFKELFKK